MEAALNAVLKLTSGPLPNDNSIQEEDFCIHGWYRFVLSFPPHLVRKYLQRLGSSPGRDVLLDPFCGTGTTLVEAKKQGFQSYGCDAHPFAALVSNVKTDWSLDREVLHEAFGRIKAGIELEQARILVARESRPVNGYSLSEDEKRILPTGFLSPKPLLKLLIVRDCILNADLEEAIKNFFLVGLAHTIANGAGNFAFGPEIYRTKPKADYGVFEHFSLHTKRMLADLARVQQEHALSAESQVFCGDARLLANVPMGISRVITSPPYPNEKDYTRTTRVEALLLRIFSDRAGLRKVKDSLLRSNTRNIFVRDSDGSHVAEFPSIQSICHEIEQRRIELEKTSGFERLYHKVVAHYFGGMRLHLKSLKPKLRRGAKLAYVVGDQMSFLMVKVPTAKLLAEIAEAEGYRVTGCDLWRERVGTKVRNSPQNEKTVRVREEVLLLENPAE